MRQRLRIYLKKVITYIDAFNLYHSIKDLANKTKGAKEYLKWQDIPQLSRLFLSRNDEILSIKFFTAYPTWKPDSCNRHKDYVAILEDLGIEVILGHFKKKEVFCNSCQKQIKKHEEKQTDVNIAIHIMQDIYESKPDIIQVISGDTDLIPPIQMAKNKGIFTNIVVPFNRKADAFNPIADKKSHIKMKHLEQCFIGASYTMSNGKTLTCPYT